MWEDVRKAAGLLDVRLHDLRHSLCEHRSRRLPWAFLSSANCSATLRRNRQPVMRTWQTIRCEKLRARLARRSRRHWTEGTPLIHPMPSRATRLARLHLWSALLSPPSPTTEPARLGVNCSIAMRVGIVVRKNEDCPAVSALLKSLEREGLIEIKRQGHMKPNIYLPRFPPKMTASNGMA
jgi:hypothetical protein